MLLNRSVTLNFSTDVFMLKSHEGDSGYSFYFNAKALWKFLEYIMIISKRRYSELCNRKKNSYAKFVLEFETLINYFYL